MNLSKEEIEQLRVNFIDMIADLHLEKRNPKTLEKIDSAILLLNSEIDKSNNSIEIPLDIKDLMALCYQYYRVRAAYFGD